MEALGSSDDRDQLDDVVDEIHVVLDRWDRRLARRPQVERRRLLLLALEREQLVTVAYDENVMAARLARLDLPPDLRRLVYQPLVWAWKDEELHADYVRGLLVRTGRPLPMLVILGRQLAGALSGWVSVVQHHGDPARARARTRVRAPVRSLAASALIGVARLSGRVSPTLARELRFQSFRRYLLLNAALEQTAEIGYERAVELAASPEERDALDRIRADEERHGRIFRLLAGVLDDHDRPRPGVTAAALARDLAAVSPWFVPAEQRPPTGDGGEGKGKSSDGRPPRAFGSNAPVRAEHGDRAQHTRRTDNTRQAEQGGDTDNTRRTDNGGRAKHGHQGDDLAATLHRALDGAGVGDLVAAHPGPVALRAAFMLGYHRDDRSNIVDPRVAEEIARYLRDHGATDVAVLEAPTVYGRFFAHRSVAEVARYFGFTSPLYRIVDLANDQVPWNFDRGLAQTTTSGTWHDAAVRLVVAKLRTDPNEIAHLSLSSLHGMDGRVTESIHPDRQVSYRNAVMMLLDHSPPDAAVVDAWGPVADGPFGVMGCARPPTERRFYAGRDALAVDAAVLADLGVADPRRAPSFRAACHWFGLDPPPPVVEGAPAPGPFGPGLRRPQATPWSRLVARLGSPVYTYASRHGELFVPALDTDAFPPSPPPGPVTRAVRWSAQRAFGLHPPDDARESTDRSVQN
ncbi:MAG TPA: DUF362 domain-containing protein [Acidimicrobiales bacterium]|nr:DUF362 domain-containing protein [Acidimicrobiales bacterium]